MLRLFAASKYFTARMEFEHWCKSRASSSIMGPKARSFAGGCSIGCGLFVHGGYGLVDGFNHGVLSDWNLFDLGLSVWVSLEITHEDGFPFELSRRMHTMSAVSNHAAECQIRDELLDTRMLWVHELDSLVEGGESLQSLTKKKRKKKNYESSLKTAGFYIFGGQDAD